MKNRQGWHTEGTGSCVETLQCNVSTGNILATGNITAGS